MNTEYDKRCRSPNERERQDKGIDQQPDPAVSNDRFKEQPIYSIFEQHKQVIDYVIVIPMKESDHQVGRYLREDGQTEIYGE